MARATSVDSTWVGTLASGVSIGGTSATLASTSGTNWPSGAGIFGIQIGEDPDTDAELLQVTRSGATLTLDASTPTLTKNHSAGANVYYLTTAPDINAKANDSAVVHNTGTESVAGDKTFSDDVVVSGDLTATGMIFAIGAANLLTLTTDYINISPNVALNIQGAPTFQGYNLAPNEGNSFGPSISGGEILYGHLGTLYLLDGGASNRTVYLNYDTALTGLSIIRNIGTTNNITIDVDPIGSYTIPATVTLTPGQYVVLAGDQGATGYVIYRIG